MTTGLWIILDHVVALLSIATWFAAGVTLALRRTRLALAVLVAAVLVTPVRVVTVAILAGRGWWFVQEKVLLGCRCWGPPGPAPCCSPAHNCSRRGGGEATVGRQAAWSRCSPRLTRRWPVLW